MLTSEPKIHGQLVECDESDGRQWSQDQNCGNRLNECDKFVISIQSAPGIMSSQNGHRGIFTRICEQRFYVLCSAGHIQLTSYKQLERQQRWNAVNVKVSLIWEILIVFVNWSSCINYPIRIGQVGRWVRSCQLLKTFYIICRNTRRNVNWISRYEGVDRREFMYSTLEMRSMSGKTAVCWWRWFQVLE